MRGNHAIAGVWEVYAPAAPFPWHMMTFTPYGTMSQSNPHEGNQDESDSTGHGVWQADTGSKDIIAGKFVEFKADRQSGCYIGKGEITFTITVKGDYFEGTANAYRYDADGKLLKGPLSSPLSGKRVKLSNNLKGDSRGA